MCRGPAQTGSSLLGLESLVDGELLDVRRSVHFDAGCGYCLLDPNLEGVELLARLPEVDYAPAAINRA